MSISLDSQQQEQEYGMSGLPMATNSVEPDDGSGGAAQAAEFKQQQQQQTPYGQPSSAGDSQQHHQQPMQADYSQQLRPMSSLPSATSSRGPKRKQDFHAGAGRAAAGAGVAGSAGSPAAAAAVGHVSTSPSLDDEDGEQGGQHVDEVAPHAQGDGRFGVGGGAEDEADALSHLQQPLYDEQEHHQQQELEREAKRSRVEGNGFERPLRPQRPVQPGGSQSSPLHEQSSGSGSQQPRRDFRDGSGSGSGSGSDRYHRRGHARRSSSESSSSGTGSGSGSGDSSSSSYSSSSDEEDGGDHDLDDGHRHGLTESERAERRAMEGLELAQGVPPQMGGANDAVTGLYAEEQFDVSQQEQQPLFHALTPNLETLLQLLMAIRLHNKEQLCRISIAAQGMKVVSMLEQSRSVCAKAYLKRDLFTEYRLNKDALPAPPALAPRAAPQRAPAVEYSLTCHLTHLITCLQLFGTPGGKDSPMRASPVLHFTVHAPDEPLILRLDGDDGRGHQNITDCELSVLDRSHLAAQDAEMFVIGHEKLLQAVITAPQLRHAFSELDFGEAEQLTVHAGVVKDAQGNEQTTLAMSVDGHGGLRVVVELSRDPMHNVFFDNKLELFRGPFRLSYDMKHLRPCIRALAKAEMSNVRINSVGLLSIQHVISGGGSASHWIEFFVAAKEAPDMEEPEGAAAAMQYQQQQQLAMGAQGQMLPGVAQGDAMVDGAGIQRDEAEMAREQMLLQQQMQQQGQLGGEQVMMQYVDEQQQQYAVDMRSPVIQQ